MRVNRDKSSDTGVQIETVGRTLETMLGGRQVTRFKRDGEQYDVIVQVAPVDRSTPADISDTYVRARDGGMVQLSNLVDVREGVAPQSLNHFNRLRAVKVTATLAPGYAIGEAITAMNDAAKRALPTTAQTDLDGQSREFRSSGGEIYFTFVLALLFIYLVLAAGYRLDRGIGRRTGNQCQHARGRADGVRDRDDHAVLFGRAMVARADTTLGLAVGLRVALAASLRRAGNRRAMATVWSATNAAIHNGGGGAARGGSASGDETRTSVSL